MEQNKSGSKFNTKVLFFVWIIIGLTMLSVWLEGSRHNFIPCTADCGETFIALQDVRNYRMYGFEYGLLQDLSTSPNLSARPYLYTHNVHIGGILFTLLDAIGITSVWGKQLFTLLGFGVGLFYVYRAVVYHTRSKWVGITLLLLFCTDYQHVFRFGLNPLRVWHWLAIFGLLFHAGRLVREPELSPWRDRLAVAGFAALAFGIGYDFAFVSAFITFFMLIFYLSRSLISRQALSIFGWLIIAFAIPVILRQLQIILVLGPTYWVTDLYYSVGIKVTFLNRFIPLPSLAEIDRFYESVNVLRPPATPALSLADLLRPLSGMFTYITLPTVGLLTVLLTIIVSISMLIVMGLYLIKPQWITNFLHRFTNTIHSEVDLLSAARLLVSLLLGIAVITVVLTPFFMQFYIKHQFPLLAAPILLIKALVLVLLIQFFLTQRSKKNFLGWIGLFIAGWLLIDHAVIQFDNIRASTPMDVSWIEDVSAKSEASFAVSWVSSAAAPFTNDWVIGVRPTQEYHILQRLKSGQDPFNKSDLLFFSERDPSINFLHPDFWLYFRTEEWGKFDYPIPICREDYLTSFIEQLRWSSVDVMPSGVRVSTSSLQGPPGELILVFAQLDSRNIGLASKRVIKAELLAYGQVISKLNYNCQSNTFFGPYQLPLNAPDGDSIFRVRLIYEDGQEYIGEGHFRVNHSAPPSPEMAFSLPQPTVEQVIAENPNLEVVAQGPEYLIIDLHSAYRQDRNTEQLADSVEKTAMYVSTSPEKVVTGMPILKIKNEIAWLKPGDLVLADQHLLRVEAGGPATILIGQEGQSILVEGIGQWDSQRQTYSGMPVFYRDGNWNIDPSMLFPSNSNADFSAGTKTNPLPDWEIGSINEGYEVIPMRDESGSFIRIKATQDMPELFVMGQTPVTTLDGTMVSLRAQIRTNSDAPQKLVLKDWIGPDETQNFSTQTDNKGSWNSLVMLNKAVFWPSPNDAYSVGLSDVKAGDWFDIRELSVFVGRLP